MEYICSICNKNFGNRKSNYIIHINRKIPCLKIPHNPSQIPHNAEFHQNIFSCEFCNKSFSRKDNLTRHINIWCKHTNKNNNTISNEIINEIKDIKQEHKKIIKINEEIKQENKEMKKKIKKLEKQNKSITQINKNTTNTNSHNNITNTINITNFEKFDYNKITDDVLLKLINAIALKDACNNNLIIDAIKEIHFNDKYPENMNMYIADKNRGIMKVCNQNKWHTKKLSYNLIEDNIKDPIIFRIRDLLNKPKYKNDTRINLILSKINDFSSDRLLESKRDREYDEDEFNDLQKFNNEIYDDISNLLYDYKNIPIDNFKNSKQDDNLSDLEREFNELVCKSY